MTPRTLTSSGPDVSKWLPDVFVVLLGLAASIASIRLDLGAPAHPGPGMWPFIVGVTMTTCGVVLCARRFLALRPGRGQLLDGEPPAPSTAQLSWRRPSLGILIVAADAAMFAYLGFLPATFLGLVAWLRLIAKEEWVPTLLWSLLTTAGLYATFVLLLNVQFPQGYLSFRG